MIRAFFLSLLVTIEIGTYSYCFATLYCVFLIHIQRYNETLHIMKAKDSYMKLLL